MQSLIPPSVVAWLIAHAQWVVLASIVLSAADAAVRGALRMLPGLGPYVMGRFPRLAHLVIAIGHMLPGVAPAVRRLWLVVTGTPFPLPIPAVVESKEGELAR